MIWENIHFLIQCYLTLGEEKFLDPIYRGMNFYLIAQDSCGAWGQQLDLKMQNAGARTYEPAAFMPSTTFTNAMLLLRFYQYTGSPKFLARVPDAIRWLEETRLSENQKEQGKTHPMFVDVKTNKPVYVHRKGSNAKYGRYYTDKNDNNLPAHYNGKCTVEVEQLKSAYQRISNLSVEEATKDSPLKAVAFEEEGTPQSFYDLSRTNYQMHISDSLAIEVVKALDEQNRWLSRGAFISNPYIGDGQRQELTDEFASSFVGDETDTSPYRDNSEQLYISTSTYIQNMKILIHYIKKNRMP